MPPENLSWVKSQKLDLFIESFSNAARTVQVRGYSETEQIVADHVTSADRSLATSVVQLTEPPIALTLRTLETSVSRGECYVKVSLRAEGVVIALLAAGYVTDAGTQAWPNGKIESSVEGRGLIRLITGTNPAAGVEISETVPTGARWRIISFRFTFLTDATVANRQPRIALDDGTSIYYRQANSTVHGASLSFSYNALGSSAGNMATGADLSLILPLLHILMAGHKITTVTALLQAGDNFDAPSYVVEEWIEP